MRMRSSEGLQLRRSDINCKLFKRSRETKRRTSSSLVVWKEKKEDFIDFLRRVGFSRGRTTEGSEVKRKWNDVGELSGVSGGFWSSRHPLQQVWCQLCARVFLKEEFAQNLDVVLKKNKVHKTFSGAFKAKLILINSPEQLKQLDNCFKM